MSTPRTLPSYLLCTFAGATLLAGCRTAPADAPAVPVAAPDAKVLDRVIVPLALPDAEARGEPRYIEQLRVVVWDASDPDGPSREVGEAVQPIVPTQVDGSALDIVVELPGGLPEGAPVYAVAEITNSRQHVFALSAPMLPDAPQALAARLPEVTFETISRDTLELDGPMPTTFINCGGVNWSVWEFSGRGDFQNAQLEYKGGGEGGYEARFYNGADIMHQVRRVPSHMGRQYAERDWGEDADIFIDDDRALLSVDGAPWQVCEITQAPLAPDHPLVGKWEVVAIDGRAPLPDTTPYVSIDPDLRIGAHAGCNGGGGQFRLDGDRLVVGSMAQTLMGCPGPLGEQEDALFGLLGERPVWTVAGDRLTLRTDDGSTIEARRAPPEVSP